MELSIASHGNTNPPIPEEKSKEVRKNDRNAKDNLKDLVALNSVVVKFPRRAAKANARQIEGWQKNEVRRLTFKEWE